MNQCLVSHYAPLIPPTQVKSKALLFDIIECSLLDTLEELPDEPFYVYFDPETTGEWCVAEKVGNAINIRFKGKDVKIWYVAYVLFLSFDGENHAIGDVDDITIDYSIVRDILFREITKDNIAEMLAPTKDEQELINEMLARSKPS